MDDCTGGRVSEHSMQDLELRLTGLLFARAILERRGVSQVELDSLTRETAYVRWRLAHGDGADQAA
jgi:hypothetical protein